MATAPTPYAVAPEYSQKFKAGKAKEILAAVLKDKLEGKEFSADHTTQWTKEIADEVKLQLKGNRSASNAQHHADLWAPAPACWVCA